MSLFRTCGACPRLWEPALWRKLPRCCIIYLELKIEINIAEDLIRHTMKGSSSKEFQKVVTAELFPGLRYTESPPTGHSCWYNTHCKKHISHPIHAPFTNCLDIHCTYWLDPNRKFILHFFPTCVLGITLTHLKKPFAFAFYPLLNFRDLSLCCNLDEVERLACFNDPKSYAGGSLWLLAGPTLPDWS